MVYLRGESCAKTVVVTGSSSNFGGQYPWATKTHLQEEGLKTRLAQKWIITRLLKNIPGAIRVTQISPLVFLLMESKNNQLTAEKWVRAARHSQCNRKASGRVLWVFPPWRYRGGGWSLCVNIFLVLSFLSAVKYAVVMQKPLFVCTQRQFILLYGENLNSHGFLSWFHSSSKIHVSIFPITPLGLLYTCWWWGDVSCFYKSQSPFITEL